jgi:hypothetical protein
LQFFPETRGATLEEISRTLDGADAVEEIKHKAAEIDNVKDIRDDGLFDMKRDNEATAHVNEVSEKSL